MIINITQTFDRVKVKFDYDKHVLTGTCKIEDCKDPFEWNIADDPTDIFSKRHKHEIAMFLASSVYALIDAGKYIEGSY